MTVIPFYGTDRPDLFAIERAAMDREGRLIEALDRALPGGQILDVGAGDGWTAEKLSIVSRRVVALESTPEGSTPDRGQLRRR